MNKKLRNGLIIGLAALLVAPLIGLIATGYAIGWGPFAELRYYNHKCYDLTSDTYKYNREKITIDGENGKIAANIYKVESSEKQQIAILSHGYGSEMWHNIATAESLAKAGINVLMFDYCGGSIHSKSDMKTTEMSILTERQDLNDVIDYAKTLDYVDASKISVIGYSQGGLVAAMTAVQRDDIYKLNLYYPALHIIEGARSQYKTVEDIPDTVKLMGMTIGRKYYEDILSLDFDDIYEYISTFSNPTLFIHGTGDKLVDYQVSVKANGMYPNSSLVTIENGAHGFTGDHDYQAVKATYEFLKSRD